MEEGYHDMKNWSFLKTALQAFTESLSRTISIILLLAFGTMALIGLKVTSPNMENTAQKYIKETNMSNFYITSNIGITKTLEHELKKNKMFETNFTFSSDAVIKNTNYAIRVSSYNKSISKPKLVSGALPSKQNEIVLAHTMRNKYKIGDKIVLYNKNHSLNKNKFIVTGFAKSADTWSNSSMGSSNVGSGQLNNYAFVSKKAFANQNYTLAEVAYKNLSNVPYYSNTYQSREKKDQNNLRKVLLNYNKKELLKLENVNDPKAEVIKSILLNTKYSIYNRSNSPTSDGYTAYKSSANGISAIGNIFPIILYFVAGLVVLTTMTRFIDEKRTESGTLLALGYSKRKIISSFIFYSLVTGGIGTIAGFLHGNYWLTDVIGRIATKGTVFSKLDLNIHMPYVLVCIVLSLCVTILPTVFVAKKELNEEPANLLIPKSPKAGTKIFLERFKFFWTRLSFKEKITFRNIFRYKTKMMMTIFGVAGSVALFFVGLGIQGSMQGIIQSQFGQVLKYDLLITRNPTNDGQQNQQLDRYIANHTKLYKNIDLKPLDLKVPTRNETQEASLIVFPTKKIDNFVNLRNRESKRKLALTNNGAILSEKLADLYKVKKGDSVKLKINGKKRKINVIGIAEMYAGHYVFMNKSYYQEVCGEKYQNSAMLLKLKNNKSNYVKRQSGKLLELKSVSGVLQNTTLIKKIETFSKSMKSVTIILIIISFVLAIIILFNLININVSERMRELSTIKVLGFHNNEVTMYIYRETIILSLFGIIIGLCFGSYIQNIIIKMIVADSIMFNPQIPISSYFITIVTFLLILLVLGIIVNFNFKKIDMLEALKSVD